MPGTTKRLLPFVFTLLQARYARFVLVDNGCETEERERLERVAGSESRFDYLRLPGESIMSHAQALAFLLSRGHDRWFAVLDSDVLASGDFIQELDFPEDGCAGVFAAPAVWRLPCLAQTPVGTAFLGGASDRLRDGTAVGLTHAAIYDRVALRTAVDKLPRSLSNGSWSRVIPAPMKRELKAKDWHYRRFGTARVAHLRLLLDGHTLSNQDSPHLHHTGGLSHLADQHQAPLSIRLRRFADRMTQGPLTPWLNLIFNLPHTFTHLTPLEIEQLIVRRSLTRATTELLDALITGEPARPAPVTGIAEVDTRFAVLRQALMDHYPGALARLSDIERQPM